MSGQYFLSKKLIFWNILAFIIVKFVFSSATFQSANILNNVSEFDSRDVVRATNEARGAYNLEPLSASYELDLAAQKKLEDMAEKGYFAHISPEGVTPWYWIKDSSYQYIYAGENLAVGFTSAADALGAWMDSPLHRENILNKNYKEIGVAVGSGKMGQVNGVLIVQMFGSRSKAPAVAAPVKTPAQITTPTPYVVVQTTLTPTPVVAGQARQAAVKLQQVSSIPQSPPVSEPVHIEYEDGQWMKNISDILNSAYIWYAFFVAAMAIMGAVIVERSALSRMIAFVHVSILILALIIPAFGATLNGIIF